MCRFSRWSARTTERSRQARTRRWGLVRRGARPAHARIASFVDNEAILSNPEARQLRILVVEDHADTLSATLELLRLLGHWAEGVGNAEGADARFLEEAFDILMVDLNLPTLSGLELVDKLHQRERLPVIFASGQPAPANVLDDAVWLRKPYSVQQLEEALDQCRALRRD
jgi:CheY-like chemotaxis protein